MAKQFNWSLERRINHHIKINANGCWEWTGSKTKNGYGQIGVGGKLFMAHRYIYEQKIGPVPCSLDLDHLCRNRCCVNPDHMEPVTRSENLKRGNSGIWAKLVNGAKTHCPKGHEYSGANLYVHPRGARCCRVCTNERARLRRKNG